MESLLADLELDFQELKYLINILSKQKDPTLRLMADRRMMQIHNRLDKLSGLLDDSESSVDENNNPLLASVETPVNDAVDVQINETVVPEKGLEETIGEQVVEEEIYIHETVEDFTAEFSADSDLTEINGNNKEGYETESFREEPLDEEEQKEEIQIQIQEFDVDVVYARQTEQKILAEQLKPSVNIIQSFSLNDVFRFSNELFDGDQQRMNEILTQISSMDSWTQVEKCLSEELQAEEENEVLTDFSECLKKFFA